MLASIPSFLLSPLINAVLPAIVGVAASAAYQYVKKAQSWVDALPPQAHAFVIGTIAIVLPQLAKLVPGFEGTDLSAVDATTVQSLVMLLATKLTHAFLTKKN